MLQESADIITDMRINATKTKEIIILYFCRNGNHVASIGGFTVTSHAVSRGSPAPLVAKRFLVGGLRVYFAWIHALFTFILLTHNIMIICSILVWGYLWHCVDGSY